jgi:hypothetical protein
VPAGQRLDHDGAPVGDADHRLVVDGDLAIAEAGSEIRRLAVQAGEGHNPWMSGQP